LKAKQQPVEALQQGVVQIPRNAGALADSRLERHLEPAMQLPDPDLVPSPEQPQSTRRAERTEPLGLVIRWVDRELQQVALLIPHTAVVGGHDAKAIGPGRQVGVERLAAVAGFLPIVVVPFQRVAEPYLLRGGQTERGEIQLQIAY
jgi:hypothetical protein